jgi:hypothetical protein
MVLLCIGKRWPTWRSAVPSGERHQTRGKPHQNRGKAHPNGRRLNHIEGRRAEARLSTAFQAGQPWEAVYKLLSNAANMRSSQFVHHNTKGGSRSISWTGYLVPLT